MADVLFFGAVADLVGDAGGGDASAEGEDDGADPKAFDARECHDGVANRQERDAEDHEARFVDVFEQLAEDAALGQGADESEGGEQLAVLPGFPVEHRLRGQRHGGGVGADDDGAAEADEKQSAKNLARGKFVGAHPFFENRASAEGAFGWRQGIGRRRGCCFCEFCFFRFALGSFGGVFFGLGDFAFLAGEGFGQKKDHEQKREKLQNQKTISDGLGSVILSNPGSPDGSDGQTQADPRTQ